LYNKLIKTSLEWRHIELAGVIFSIFGLVIAVIDYEVNLNYDGYRGLLLLHDNGVNTQADIDKAIADRVGTPKTQLVRWTNAMTSVITIAFLIWRKIDKTKWGND